MGLPTDGQVGDRRRVSLFVLPAASVDITATVADVVAVQVEGRPTAVLGAGNVLLGAVQGSAALLPPTTPVARIMISAPGTIRGEMRVDEALAQLDEDGLDHVFVTTVSGELVGLVIPGEVHV